MKKLLFLFISFIVLNKTNAQVVFCPSGAEWSYTFDANMTGRIGNEKITYTGTTTVGGETVKMLSHRYGFIFTNDLEEPFMTTYIKQKGDTVFMQNVYTQNTWQILYNFNVLPGHTWQTKVYNKTYTITVDSVSSVTVNNLPLKRIFVKYVHAFTSVVSITERFGCSDYMFNFVGGGVSDGDYFQDFLCYKDNAFGQKQFSNKPCDFVNYVGLSETQFDGNEVSVFPNPTNGKLNIQLSTSQPVNIDLSNSLGQLVYSEKNLNSEVEIDLGFLPAGIYYLRLKNKLEQKVIKVVKE